MIGLPRVRALVLDRCQHVGGPAEVGDIRVSLHVPAQKLDARDLALIEATERLAIAVEENRVIDLHPLILSGNGRPSGRRLGGGEADRLGRRHRARQPGGGPDDLWLGVRHRGSRVQTPQSPVCRPSANTASVRSVASTSDVPHSSVSRDRVSCRPSSDAYTGNTSGITSTPPGTSTRRRRTTDG